MAVTCRFICCLLYWTAINGLGVCGKKEVTDESSHDRSYGDKKKLDDFKSQRVSDYLTSARYDDRSAYNYMPSTSEQYAENFLTYGSTVSVLSLQSEVNPEAQNDVNGLQGSIIVEKFGDGGAEQAAESSEQQSFPTTGHGHHEAKHKKWTRKKRVVDSQRMFRYRKPPETSANLSENPLAYMDEDIRGNRNKKNKHARGNRNRKQGNRKKPNAMETGHTLEEELSMAGSSKSARNKGKARKRKPAAARDGQSNRRFRQHMQHKKKVKQFLQKRIQEQIAQRRHRRETVA